MIKSSEFQYNFLIHLLLQSYLSVEVYGRSNTEPCNIGFIFSLPWDISNTLRAPIAGPLSILLTGGLSIILLVSLIAAPFWYVLGYPKRRYHLHSIVKSRSMGSEFGRGLSEFDLDQGDFGVLQGNSSSLWWNSGETLNEDGKPINYPDFMESMFLFIPDFDVGCKKLMACHAHGFLPALPSKFLEIYRYFSKKLLQVPPEFKDAIKGGIADQGFCIKSYGSQCSQDILTIARQTVFELIPKDTRELWNIRM